MVVKVDLRRIEGYQLPNVGREPQGRVVVFMVHRHLSVSQPRKHAVNPHRNVKLSIRPTRVCQIDYTVPQTGI